MLPGVRRACDAYVEFVESHDLLESVAASLTELFAGDIMGERIAAFEKHYPWVDADGLRYFRSRTVQAPDDARHGLAFVLEHARTAPTGTAARPRSSASARSSGACSTRSRRPTRRPRFARAAQPRLETRSRSSVLPERAVKLAGSAREILALVRRRRTAIEIAAALRERHPEVERVADDVHDFLDEMVRLGVLERERAR